jgi:hypothetical protein
VPMSTSRLAYEDVFECYERALKDEFGIRIRFETEGDAMHFRSRLNTARSIDRRDNREIYPREHPMYGVSPYDRIACRLRAINNYWYLYLLPILNSSALEIESLTSFEVPAPPKREPTDYQLTYNGGKPQLALPSQPEVMARPRPEPPMAPIPQPLITIRRR